LRKTGAERVALFRQGIKTYRVPLHTKTIVANLVADGLLAEADMEDDIAIGEAIAKDYMQRPRMLRVQPAKPEPKPKTYKPKQQKKPRHGPCLTLGLGEKARYEAQMAANKEREIADDERWRQLEEEQARRDREYEAEYLTQRQWRLMRLEDEKEKADEDIRRQIANGLVQAKKKRVWQDFGKSGVRKRGGNPIPNGFGPMPYRKSRADTVAPIKQLTRSEVKAREKPLGPLQEKSQSVHTFQLGEGELDRYVADEEGCGKPSARRARDTQHEDGFRKKGNVTTVTT
jgi:hypothetical protein